MAVGSQQGAEAVKASIAGWLRQLQSYLRRLPLLTRAIVCVVPAVHVLSMCGAPLEDMWALDPKKMDLSQSMFVICFGILGGRGG
jgi:hypothetical protein